MPAVTEHSALPVVVACTVAGLHAGAATEAEADQSPLVKFVAPGRVIVAMDGQREVLVAMHPDTAEVFAMDRNCYHVGYPLDLGPIDDVPRRGPTAAAERRPAPKTGTAHLVLRCDASAATAGRLLCEDTADIEESHVACITCPLHNRIFDLRSGDMIALEVDRAVGERAAPEAECAAVSAGCRQRIHKVALQEGLVTFADSAGHSNPLQGLRHLTGQRVQSDAENRAR